MRLCDSLQVPWGREPPPARGRPEQTFSPMNQSVFSENLRLIMWGVAIPTAEICGGGPRQEVNDYSRAPVPDVGCRRQQLQRCRQNRPGPQRLPYVSGEKRMAFPRSGKFGNGNPPARAPVFRPRDARRLVAATLPVASSDPKHLADRAPAPAWSRAGGGGLSRPGPGRKQETGT